MTDTELIAAAIRVARTCLSFYRPMSMRATGPVPVYGMRDGGSLDHFRNATATGLMLEVCDDQPVAVWTPWGRYEFARPGPPQKLDVMSVMLDSLGAVPTELLPFPELTLRSYTVYAVSKVSSIELPPADAKMQCGAPGTVESKQRWLELWPAAVEAAMELVRKEEELKKLDALMSRVSAGEPSES